jgi:hypothetical protein
VSAFAVKSLFCVFLFSPGKMAKFIFTAYRGFGLERPDARKGRVAPHVFQTEMNECLNTIIRLLATSHSRSQDPASRDLTGPHAGKYAKIPQLNYPQVGRHQVVHQVYQSQHNKVQCQLDLIRPSELMWRLGHRHSYGSRISYVQLGCSPLFSCTSGLRSPLITESYPPVFCILVSAYIV